MSLQLNKAVLAGYLGREPEMTSVAEARSCAVLVVATSDYWTDKGGERHALTDWHRVVVWNQHLVKQIAKGFYKGAAVYIEGKLETRRWTDKAGAQRNITEIIVRPWQGDVRLISPPQTNRQANRSVGQPHAASTAGTGAE